MHPGRFWALEKPPESPYSLVNWARRLPSLLKSSFQVHPEASRNRHLNTTFDFTGWMLQDTSCPDSLLCGFSCCPETAKGRNLVLPISPRLDRQASIVSSSFHLPSKYFPAVTEVTQRFPSFLFHLDFQVDGCLQRSRNLRLNSE